MSKIISAAATGLPAITTSRRTILTGLAVLPVAAAPAAMTSALAGPDAALIARAASVEALAIRRNETIAHACRLENESEELVPIATRPPEPDSVPGFDTTIERFEDGSLVLRQRPLALNPAAVLAAQRQEETRKGWEGEREATGRRIGLNAAHEVHSEAYRRLETAVRDFTPMTPSTIAGLAAKARVAVLLDPHNDFTLNDWEFALRAAVLRDVVRIGGVA